MEWNDSHLEQQLAQREQILAQLMGWEPLWGSGLLAAAALSGIKPWSPAVTR